ncbi:AraC family transcriptional regulator [Ruminococcus sp. OA3]|uniref:helix-turn-helix transcriptional regulator n=1 Tax=Ruminococcus sp. OA3 TaxID=2914164 RepID=UPI001F059170|nr:helix-turn-helix domain-containing protein [Ruminococcus sp. OA3]MCH1981058.1 AraC family transcriptional regulator [Ruminococcus sp. OA3]
MFWSETNRKIAEVFEGGQLPTMVYISKQGYERKKVLRSLHRHESICELLLIYRGEGSYQVEGKHYPLKEGSLIYYNQGDLHEVVSGSEQEIGSYCIGITNLQKKGLPRNYLIEKGGPYVRQTDNLFPILRSMCEQMYELEGADEEGRLVAQLQCASFIVMTSRLKSFPTVAAQRTSEEQNVLRIRDYLNQHFTENITLEMTAKDLGYSATYVSHIFKNSTGQTPIQYVIRRRVGLAQTLLISTDFSATQIATMVGYDNTNYFSTLFAKTVGMTPIRYRHLYKEEMKGTNRQS